MEFGKEEWNTGDTRYHLF